MKRSNYIGWTIALLMAAGFCAVTPGLSAQSRISAQQQQGQQNQSQQQSKTFSGTIMKLQNGNYALVTGKTAEGKLAGHLLDDPGQNAKKYDGKQVTVTGTLDMASNTIHVTNIQAA